MKSATLFLFYFNLLAFLNPNPSAGQLAEPCDDSLRLVRLLSDTIFDSPQQINLLVLNKKALPAYKIDIAFQASELLKTSQIAGNSGALAAINGSFFDMELGGGVTYVEKADSVISRTRAPDLEWGVSDSIINGALVMDKCQHLTIEAAKKDHVYENSVAEAYVMVSGPLLINDAIPQELPEMNFTNLRHPRTCLCITRNSIILVTVDGRSEQAAGMSLKEVQQLLLDLGCVEAINLDGGGSTSMWMKEQGIVNIPSDKTGERPVANAILILKE